MILFVTTWSSGRRVTFSTISPRTTKSELEYAVLVPGSNCTPGTVPEASAGPCRRGLDVVHRRVAARQSRRTSSLCCRSQNDRWYVRAAWCWRQPSRRRPSTSGVCRDDPDRAGGAVGREFPKLALVGGVLEPRRFSGRVTRVGAAARRENGKRGHQGERSRCTSHEDRRDATASSGAGYPTARPPHASWRRGVAPACR
jgi:hypothetical protein